MLSYRQRLRSVTLHAVGVRHAGFSLASLAKADAKLTAAKLELAPPIAPVWTSCDKTTPAYDRALWTLFTLEYAPSASAVNTTATPGGAVPATAEVRAGTKAAAGKKLCSNGWGPRGPNSAAQNAAIDALTREQRAGLEAVAEQWRARMHALPPGPARSRELWILRWMYVHSRDGTLEGLSESEKRAAASLALSDLVAAAVTHRAKKNRSFGLRRNRNRALGSSPLLFI